MNANICFDKLSKQEVPTVLKYKNGKLTKSKAI